MPNLPISQLPQSTTLQGNELFVDVQGGTTKYTTLDDIAGYTTGSVMVTGSLSGTTLTFQKGDSSTFDINLGGIPTVYGLFNQTGSSTPVSNSIAEESLIGGGVGTLSVPANGFRQGDAYRAIFTGHCTFHNGDNLRIRIKADSTILSDTGNISLATATNKHWKLEVFFSINQIGAAGTASISTGGVFNYSEDQASKISGINYSTENSSSFDTTIPNQLEVTAQFDHDDNIIYTNLFTLTKTF